MSLNPKLLLPVALGVSLVSVTAFVVYYVFKKDDEESENNSKSVKTSRVNVIEITVPKSIVPALIGRSGSNIKEIESKSGAMIHFKKFSDKDYDVCIVRGRSEASQLAETMIHDFMAQQPLIEESSMEVPGWSCGRIIGTGGENINEISHRSGARVKIEGPSSGDRASSRQISFRGTKEQIAVAKELIENCVSQEKCRREIEQSKRSPRVATAPVSPAAGAGAPAHAHKHAKYTTSESSGASIEVYVSAVSSPSRFWVQFVGPQVSQLDDLVAQMTDYYGDRDNRAAHQVSHVSVGQVVAAVFRHDGRWYRARVHDILPNEFDATQQVADVFYVDYGDSEYVAVHELCDLRADLLRLRFQAMECFLAGVKPAGKEEDVVGVTAAGARWDRWHPQAIERFEELTQVARWKPLVSKTCTYKKTAAAGEKEKEIPGIKLYDHTDEGELDIGSVLIAEGWAVDSGPGSARQSPAPAPATPFGDLGNSRILGMLGGPGRASSLPKDHKDDGSKPNSPKAQSPSENDRMTTSQSLASGLEKKRPAAPTHELSYPTHAENQDKEKQVNGAHDEFIQAEKSAHEGDHTLPSVKQAGTGHEGDHPLPLGKLADDFKANMNRIDSHHGDLSSLAKQDRS